MLPPLPTVLLLLRLKMFEEEHANNRTDPLDFFFLIVIYHRHTFLMLNHAIFTLLVVSLFLCTFFFSRFLEKGLCWFVISGLFYLFFELFSLSKKGWQRVI